MLDREDLEKLKEILATKEDIKIIKEDIKTIQGDFAWLKTETITTGEDIKKVKDDLDGLREMVQVLVVSIDNLVGAVSGLTQEYTMIANKIDRHEKCCIY